MAKIRKRTWTTASGEIRIAFSVNVETDGSRSRKQFATRREADAYRIHIEGQMHTGTYRADAARVTVEEIAKEFLEHCKGRMERRERMTRKNYLVYEGHIRNYISPAAAEPTTRTNKRLVGFTKPLSSTKLAHLTSGRIHTFRDDLRGAGVSIVTTRRILGTLLQVLNFAVSRDVVAVNAAKGVKVIGRRDEGAKKVVPPSKEAMRSILEAASEDFRVKLMFASATGVRAGELHALRWRHVELTRGEVCVETRVDAFGEEDTTKTAAGIRTVPIGRLVVASLKAWKLRSSFKKPDDLVFPNREGGYVDHSNMVKREFKPLFEKLAELHAANPAAHPEAPRSFNWHALRHFAISCWIEADLKPKTVQTFAGHSSLQVTMDRYGHLFKSDDHRAAMDAIAAGLF